MCTILHGFAQYLAIQILDTTTLSFACMMLASAAPVERAAALRDLKLFGRESRQFVIASWPLSHGPQAFW